MLLQTESDEAEVTAATEAKALSARQERHLFDWHLANLEFANAALASTLSLRHWDQDDPYELLGAHAFVAGGFASPNSNVNMSGTGRPPDLLRRLTWCCTVCAL